MNFRLGEWRDKSMALADQAAEALGGHASGLTDQAVRVGVDQGLRILSVAVDQIRSKRLAPPPMSVGVGMNLGLFYLEMQVHVPGEGEPGDVDVRLKQARPGEGAEAPPRRPDGGAGHVVP